jgi:hypothetical protein
MLSAPVKPWRVILKAIVLFCVLNIVLAPLYPWLSNHQVYNHILPGRLRFPWIQKQIAYSVNLYEDMDAMFSSHILAAGEKPADEFRVLFLGDSSFWGDGIAASDTLTEQVNRLDLRTCRNQRIVAYNLAMPSLYVMKDLLFLNRGVQYKPDLIVWGVTLRSLSYSNQNADLLLPSHSDEVLALITRYKINIPTDSLKPGTVWNRTLWAARVNLRKLFILQENGLTWMATGIDGTLATTRQVVVGNDVNPKDFNMLHASTITAGQLMFDVLNAGDDLARPAPILILNEPIFIASGKNSQQYYNAYYPRRPYDEYRKFLSDWAQSRGQPYIDAWNSIPPDEFTDTPFHLTPDGEKQLASILVPSILQLSCQGGQ